MVLNMREIQMEDIPILDDPQKVSKEFKSKLMKDFFKKNFPSKIMKPKAIPSLGEHRSGSVVTFSN